LFLKFCLGWGILRNLGNKCSHYFEYAGLDPFGGLWSDGIQELVVFLWYFKSLWCSILQNEPKVIDPCLHLYVVWKLL